MTIEGAGQFSLGNSQIIDVVNSYLEAKSSSKKLTPLLEGVIRKTFDFFKENNPDISCEQFPQVGIIICKGAQKSSLVFGVSKDKFEVGIQSNEIEKELKCHLDNQVMCKGFDRAYTLIENHLDENASFEGPMSSDQNLLLYGKFLSKGQIKPQEQLENFSNPMTSLYKGVALTVPGLSLVSTIYFTYKSLESARKIHLEGYDRSRLLATAAHICGAVLSGSVLCSSVSAWSK